MQATLFPTEKNKQLKFNEINSEFSRVFDKIMVHNSALKCCAYSFFLTFINFAILIKNRSQG